MHNIFSSNIRSFFMLLLTTLNIFKTGITFFLWVPTAVTATVLSIPLACLPIRYRNSKAYYWIAYITAYLLIKATFINIRIIGKEQLKNFLKQPSVIIANHTSAIDIPLLQLLIGPTSHIWFSKEAYAKIPLFGFILRRMHIIVRRQSTIESAKTMSQVYAHKENHNHILIFPEGMRHHDGNVHKFFSGFAVTAQHLNRPVVPIAIHGLHKVFPKKSWIIHSFKQCITLSIGEPMWYTEHETRQEFIKHVHTWFVKELNRLSSKK